MSFLVNRYFQEKQKSLNKEALSVMKLLIGAQKVKCVFFKDDWAFFIKPIFDNLNIRRLDIQGDPFPITICDGGVIMLNSDTSGIILSFGHPVRSGNGAAQLLIELNIRTLTGIANSSKTSSFWFQLEGELWLSHDV
jgi:hypothetical protein